LTNRDRGPNGTDVSRKDARSNGPGRGEPSPQEAGGSFLERWSARKRGVAADAPPPPLAERASAGDGGALGDQPPGADGAQTGSEPNDAGREPETEAELLERLQLPDPTKMVNGDDFSGFMRAGVPEWLRRKALRRLWTLNPVLANLDELLDYGEDFTDAATVVANMQTTYQVGKGLLAAQEPDEQEPDEDALAEVEPDAEVLAAEATDHDASGQASADDTHVADAAVPGSDAEAANALSKPGAAHAQGNAPGEGTEPFHLAQQSDPASVGSAFQGWEPDELSQPRPPRMRFSV